MTSLENDLRSLAAAGRAMRDVQKQFFKTRDRNLVPRAKELEREFDKLLAPILDRMTGATLL